MRRGEYFPLYRASQLGGARTKPFTRPAHDSLPVFQCTVTGCGTDKTLFTDEPEGFSVDYTLASLAGTYTLTDEDARHVWLCSLGCLSRWAITQELRQP